MMALTVRQSEMRQADVLPLLSQRGGYALKNFLIRSTASINFSYEFAMLNRR